RAGHHRAARHATSSLRGADLGRSVPPHSRDDPARGRTTRVPGRQSGRAPHAPDGARRCPGRPRPHVAGRCAEGAHRAMTRALPATLAALVVALVLDVVPAAAYDPDITFQKGTFVLSVEGGGGAQTQGPDEHGHTGLKLYYFGARASILPLSPLGKG